MCVREIKINNRVEQIEVSLSNVINDLLDNACLSNPWFSCQIDNLMLNEATQYLMAFLISSLELDDRIRQRRDERLLRITFVDSSCFAFDECQWLTSVLILKIIGNL